MRVVFAGTPEPAQVVFDALLGSRHDVAAVITRPDAPTGRGRHVHRSPVAERAAEHGIETLTPRKPSEPDFLARLAELAPDAVPVVAYGALIPPSALAIPRLGWVNLHFSLLPAWRGAAPVQHAIWRGDDITGATTFRIEEGLDTGPTFGVVTEEIRSTDTAGDLLQRLSVSGAELLVRTLDALDDGTIEAVAQPPDGVSRAPKITPGDARIDWHEPALAVDRRIRACTPAPGAWSTLHERRVKLGPARALPSSELEPGEIRASRGGVAVGTASFDVALTTAQPEGRAAMPAADWARGAHLSDGDRFV